MIKSLGRKCKMFLGIPSMGDRADYQCHMLRILEERYSEYIDFVYPDDCIYRIFHDHARNGVVDEFLQSDCDVLWFLDSDVVPSKHVLDLIVCHWDKWKASGCAYPIWVKQPGNLQQQIMFTAYKGIGTSEHGNQGIRMASVPFEGQDWVDGLATGCLFLKRECFEGLEKPYFEFKYDPTSRNVIEGEDLGFCLKMHAKGIKFFVDYSMVCKHYKRVDLLDVNFYAIDWSNQKIAQYDQWVKAEARPTIQAAFEKGFKACAEKLGYGVDFNGATKAEPLVPDDGMTRTKSGIILPGV